MQLTSPDTDSLNRRPEPTTESNSNRGEDSTSAAGLPLDVVFDLLSNERRRRVLRFLCGESASTTLGELAEYVAAIENGKSVRALSSAERKRVYIVLYQCHLPKLDDAGVIEFDENRKTIESGENLPILLNYLFTERDDGNDGRREVTVYLGLIFGVGGLFIAQGYFLPNAWISGVLIGVLVVVIVITTVAMKRATTED